MPWLLCDRDRGQETGLLLMKRQSNAKNRQNGPFVSNCHYKTLNCRLLLPEKIEKQTEESVLPTTDEETVSKEIEKPPQTETAKEDLPPEESTEQKTSEAPDEKEREEPKEEPPEKHPERKDETPKNRREAAGWDDVSQELRTHRKSLHVEDGSKAKTTQDLRQVKDAWRYTQLDTRVTATEEGMMRVEELEEARVVFDEDHKGDLELVNTKVDQTEFETAIEELGEAIGLLGIKFQKKNEEWEERAADVWRALDGKMSRDIFDEAVLKINSRLTALLYGLKKIKKVVENLLYPDASGVTSFLRNVSDAYAKLPTHDEPPFCASPDTIIRQRQEIEFSVPKVRAKQQHRELIFTKKIKISASTDIITDSAGNLQSFAPMRREIILSPPETNRQYKPTTILAPLSTGTSSYQDYSSTS
ncbi:hypothetical protein HNY73_022143 [Argiope bruennichi]|uniref:Uncharacterized protein n=1 Tax=Argiope bruennichi TaxID=94029 RepID=A0A8T0E3K8_ARGBR|nr:hypothetical protein HNY73_022143 [Argiope bruennichi]